MSGIVPPEVSAVVRAPRRPRKMPIDRVAMDERAATAPAGREALGQHAHDRVEILAGQGTERPGAAQPIVKLGFRPILRRDFRDNLLRKHVERPFRDRQAVKLPATDAVEKGSALDQLVARERKQAPLGRAADRVTGTTDALQETSRSSAANRSDKRDRRRRYRCRARARRSPPALSVRRA